MGESAVCLSKHTYNFLAVRSLNTHDMMIPW